MAVGEGIAVGVGSGVGVAVGAGVGAAVGTCVAVGVCDGNGVALGCGVLVGIGFSGAVAMTVGAGARMVDTVASGVTTLEMSCVSRPLFMQAKLATAIRARTAKEIRVVTTLCQMNQRRAVSATLPRFRLEGAREWVAGEVFAHGVA